jgi:DNA-binding PadR family transcriptional regulator
VKLSKHERSILKLIEPGIESFGLRMVIASTRDKSITTLRRGHIYVVLSRMVDKGWLLVRKAPPDKYGMQRRLFRLTDLGAQLRKDL